MQIANNKVVTIEYTVKTEEGDVIDSSEGKDALKYLHGAKNIIPGLEVALDGLSIGEDFEATIAPKDAYGERLEELIQLVPREAFEGIDDLELGMSFNAEGPQGPVTVTIVGIEGDDITIDANHPLSGVVLCFSGKVQDVRDASEEEVAQGSIA